MPACWWSQRLQGPAQWLPRRRVPATAAPSREGPGRGGGSTSQEFRDAKGQVERLPGVQPGVARRRVAGIEVHFEDLLGAAQTFRHVVSRQLDVQPARPGPLVAVDVEEGTQLGEDVVEAAC